VRYNVAPASLAERSLLDNEEVSSYLQDIDSVVDFESERSTLLTSTPQFRAEVAALGEGMADHDATHEPAQATPPPTQRYEFAPAPPEDESERTRSRGTSDNRIPLTGVGTALFLLGMSLLGASSAAIVFHDRLFRILGW
jgi:hypothetical protein